MLLLWLASLLPRYIQPAHLVKSYERFSSKIKNDLIVSESQNLLTCKMVELFDWEPLQSMKFMPHRQFCPDSM